MNEQLHKLAEYYIEHPKIKPCRMLGMHIENVNYQQKLVCCLLDIWQNSAEQDFTGKAPERGDVVSSLSEGNAVRWKPVQGGLAEYQRDSALERWCGAGVSLRAYDVDGNVYPCHLFQPISSDCKQPIKEINANFQSFDTMDSRCINCPIYNVCPTCYGHNFVSTGNIAKRDEFLCQFTKLNTLVTSYIWLKKFEHYHWKDLNLTLQQYRALFDGAKIIQETLPATMN